MDLRIVHNVLLQLYHETVYCTYIQLQVRLVEVSLYTNVFKFNGSISSKCSTQRLLSPKIQWTYHLCYVSRGSGESIRTSLKYYILSNLLFLCVPYYSSCLITSSLHLQAIAVHTIAVHTCIETHFNLETNNTAIFHCATQTS